MVRDARVGILATIEPDGRPHLVPITFAVVDDRVYSAVDHKPKSTTDLKRLRNIERDPRVTLLIESYDEDWLALWWCRLRGSARLLADEDESGVGVGALVMKYGQYRPRPPSGTVIAVDVEEWTGWAATADPS